MNYTTFQQHSLLSHYFSRAFPRYLDSLLHNLESLRIFSQVSIQLPPLLTGAVLFGSANVDSLPSTLKRLTLYEFNSPVDHLPSFLTHLTFDTRFTHPIDHLPDSLTHLTFLSTRLHAFNLTVPHFNHPIDYLPTSLTHLTLGTFFNHPADYLPPSLVQLFFCLHFSQPLNYLPYSLIHLEFALSSQFQHSLNNLPPSLTHLILPNRFNRPILLPLSLTHLEIGSDFNRPIVSLPPTLKYFSFDRLVPYTYSNSYYFQGYCLFWNGQFRDPLPPLPSTLTTLKIKRLSLIQSLPL
jgi:hypothetical protein